jgi:photosystem II stability/assembly factor-like uncharacterized protein
MDSLLLRSLEWRCVGPHRGGRVVAVAGHPVEKATFYFGACAGGVWKTTSGGAQWENISDGFLTTAAVGAIAVSPSDPNVIYVGTGESTIRGDVSHGDGVYVSSDGGSTWTNVGLADTRHIGDIIIHPKDPAIAYVAALGHAWGPNAERGVFRTTDGGKHWSRSLFKSERAGAVDLAMDPHFPDVLYATIWQAQRYPHALSSGGEDSGLWKTTDGGETWSDITRAKGLPKGLLGKIGVAASPARPGRVWALIEAADEKGQDDGGLFRSDDWGATWERLSQDLNLRRRPWYYMHIYADPQDADTVWVLNLQCWKSTDGGKTFVAIPTPHGDNHDLWIDPQDSSRLIESHDGGACVSFDGGRTWSSILNQPTAQMYHVTADDQIPYYIYGSQQDNWAMRLPSLDFEGAISWKDYVQPGGGESGYIAVSRKPPHRVFGGSIGSGVGDARLIAWDPVTGQKRNVSVWPDDLGNGMSAADMRYRFQWTFPIETSPHDPSVIYACSNFVHRTTDEGASWEIISPDLTRNEPSRLGPSGGPITADNSGAEVYCTIFAFRESPHEPGVLWAGSDDGVIHLSRNGGQDWQNVTPPDLPEWALISIIEPSPHDPATAYVAATRYKLDDTRPYLFKTSDYGASWTAITTGIPDHEFTRVIREDPNRRGLLYAGTETGVYISFDDGASWQRFQSNLPVAPIHDLIVKGTDLVAATHGRSFWILDDLSPLHQVGDEQANAPIALFAPRDTIRFKLYGLPITPQTKGYVSYRLTGPVTVAYRAIETASGALDAAVLDAGKNPPQGVIISYALAQTQSDEMTLRILSADGTVVRVFTSKSEETPHLPAQAGMNRFVWDLRYAKPTALEEAEKKDVSPFAKAQEDAIAPRALPGDYLVQLTAGDISLTQRFSLLPDPRLSVTAEDLQTQFDLKLAIRDLIDQVHRSVNQIRRTRKQVEQWEGRAQPDEGQQRLAEAAASLKDQLQSIEEALINVNAEKIQPGLSKVKERLVALGAMVDESDDRPTKSIQEQFALLRDAAQAQLDRLQGVMSEAVSAFNEVVRELSLPAIASDVGS